MAIHVLVKNQHHLSVFPYLREEMTKDYLPLETKHLCLKKGLVHTVHMVHTLKSSRTTRFASRTIARFHYSYSDGKA